MIGTAPTPLQAALERAARVRRVAKDWLRERIPEGRRALLSQRVRRLTRPARLGTLRRTTPLSQRWGFDRGTALDRYYIEQFLVAHRSDIRGRVLEVKDSAYTNRFGTAVTRRDVLDINPANALATVVADLAAADHVPANQFDCFIFTQTLHLIYDFQAALRHSYRILRPGGVLLATMPTVSRVTRGETGKSEYWRFTAAACERMFGDIFGPGNMHVRAYGNVLTAIAFLTGMAHEELSRRELDTHDPHFPVLVGVRAVKALNSPPSQTMTDAATDESSGSRVVDSPAASLIICSRNRPELLAQCVESVRRGNTLPAEVIVVDQSQTPHASLRSQAESPSSRLRYFWTPHAIGLSRASNTAARAASNELLVFTHDDVLVTSTWFETIVGALRAAGPRTVITGQVLPSESYDTGAFAPSVIASGERTVYEGRIGRDVLFPNNMALYRSAIETVGGFDERLGPGTPYPAAEDNDFAFRLLEQGFRIVYEPGAVVYHQAWRDEQTYVPLRWSYGRGQGAYYAKHLSFHDRYMWRRMRWDLLRHLIKLGRRAWRQPRLAVGDAAYVLGMLSGAAQWWITQRGMR